MNFLRRKASLLPGFKFAVYQAVWIMYQNRPKRFLVLTCLQTAQHWKRGTENHYYIVESMIGAGFGNNEGFRVAEEELYETREALIASLSEHREPGDE